MNGFVLLIGLVQLYLVLGFKVSRYVEEPCYVKKFPRDKGVRFYTKHYKNIFMPSI